MVSTIRKISFNSLSIFKEQSKSLPNTDTIDEMHAKYVEKSIHSSNELIRKRSYECYLNETNFNSRLSRVLYCMK